jgi:hypothetical protein
VDVHKRASPTCGRRSCQTLGPSHAQVEFASSKRRAESLRCCLASVCVGRPSFGGRRAVCGLRERFCSSLGVGCLSFGSQRSACFSSTRSACTVVLATQLSNSAVSSAAMGSSRLLRGARKVVFLCKCSKRQVHSPSLPWLPPLKVSLCRGIGRLQPPLSSRLLSPALLRFALPPSSFFPLATRAVFVCAHLFFGHAVKSCLASTAGLTRRCSGLPSAAAELQR